MNRKCNKAYIGPLRMLKTIGGGKTEKGDMMHGMYSQNYPQMINSTTGI